MRFLQLHELGQVVVIERVVFTQVAAWVELVIPNFARRRAFLEEEHYSLHTGALEGATRAVEHGVEITAFQEQFAQHLAASSGTYAGAEAANVALLQPLDAVAGSINSALGGLPSQAANVFNSVQSQVLNLINTVQGQLLNVALAALSVFVVILVVLIVLAVITLNTLAPEAPA